MSNLASTPRRTGSAVPLAPFALLVLFAVISASGSAALAQAVPSDTAMVTDSDASTANGEGPGGVIPAQRGFNASLASSSQHDSAAGWSSILTPDVAYRLNRFLSADFSTPAFAYLMASINTGTKALPVYTLLPRHFILGDSTLAGHFDLNTERLSYNFSATMGIPTGNNTYGLTANQFTYDFNNHVDTSLGRLSPNIELGIGDTSSLVRPRVKRGRAYTTVGLLAHFQAGTSVELPLHASFEADAYEELPIGNQNVYAAIKTRRLHTRSVLVSSGVAEDNGFSTSLDIPVNPHIVLSGLYGHSLRQHDDTAGFSLTFLLRAAPRESSTRD